MIAKAARKPRASQSRGVQSMDVGLRILEVLAAHDSALPLKTISEAVEMAPSNVHRYLTSFVQAGLLRQDPDTSRYDLGRLALQVGLAALGRDKVLRSAPAELKKIVGEFGLLGIIVAFGNQGPTIVRFLQTSPPLTMSLGLGSIIPMLRSASGHLFAAFLPEEQTRALIERELKGNASGYELTASTPRTPAELRKLVEKVRRQFHAAAEVDVSPGLRVVAGPVLNERGEILASLSLMGLDPRLGSDHPALAALLAACEQLSRSAGYTGHWAGTHAPRR